MPPEHHLPPGRPWFAPSPRLDGRRTGYRVSPDARILQQITELIEAGKVIVNIDRVYPLEEAAAAHIELEKGHTRGKIVLDVSPE